MGKIRIIGGTHRSRLLPVLDSDGLRPTLDRVRETLFNWLGQDLSQKKCLDLFAGSGSLGFEAISRNATSVVMVEKDFKVARQLKLNIELLKINNCQVNNMPAFDYLNGCLELFDVIFLDPPYQSNLLQKSLELCPRYLKPDGRVYIEFENRPNLDGYRILKESKAGTVTYALLTFEE